MDTLGIIIAVHIIIWGVGLGLVGFVSFAMWELPSVGWEGLRVIEVFAMVGSVVTLLDSRY